MIKISSNLVLNSGHTALVEMHFKLPGAVQLDANPLADNFGWENQVLKHAVVHGCKCTTPGPLLLAL